MTSQTGNLLTYEKWTELFIPYIKTLSTADSNKLIRFIFEQMIYGSKNIPYNQKFVDQYTDILIKKAYLPKVVYNRDLPLNTRMTIMVEFNCTGTSLKNRAKIADNCNLNYYELTRALPTADREPGFWNAMSGKYWANYNANAGGDSAGNYIKLSSRVNIITQELLDNVIGTPYLFSDLYPNAKIMLATPYPS